MPDIYADSSGALDTYEACTPRQLFRESPIQSVRASSRSVGEVGLPVLDLSPIGRTAAVRSILRAYDAIKNPTTPEKVSTRPITSQTQKYFSKKAIGLKPSIPAISSASARPGTRELRPGSAKQRTTVLSQARPNSAGRVRPRMEPVVPPPTNPRPGGTSQRRPSSASRSRQIATTRTQLSGIHERWCPDTRVSRPRSASSATERDELKLSDLQLHSTGRAGRQRRPASADTVRRRTGRAITSSGECIDEGELAHSLSVSHLRPKSATSAKEYLMSGSFKAPFQKPATKVDPQKPLGFMYDKGRIEKEKRAFLHSCNGGMTQRVISAYPQKPRRLDWGVGQTKTETHTDFNNEDSFDVISCSGSTRSEETPRLTPYATGVLPASTRTALLEKRVNIDQIATLSRATVKATAATATTVRAVRPVFENRGPGVMPGRIGPRTVDGSMATKKPVQVSHVRYQHLMSIFYDPAAATSEFDRAVRMRPQSAGASARYRRPQVGE
ncbi:hypothetical protein GMRT_14033 [Giardia muris]|uniref:Uncharacterized protein n=1 Tax=Giardia muris TaxID=5742 RepID=A0A4Z1SUC3_GIAMU|nr:hypothetical protein GMRT_14033 [Giardia muris]|eukprot:TNJ27208.1 hypothetical protein GMRT_14033 [Giardia muris]